MNTLRLTPLLALLFACAKDDSATDTATDDSATDDSAADDSATDTAPEVSPCPDGLTDPAISTSTGCVTGFVAEGQERFLGVPYAAPPVGALRVGFAACFPTNIPNQFIEHWVLLSLIHISEPTRPY